MSDPQKHNKNNKSKSPLSLNSPAGRFFILGLAVGILILPALANFGLLLPAWMNP